MQIRFLPSLVLLAGMVTAGDAQTPSTAQPNAPSAPAPTLTPNDQQPSEPAYNPDRQKQNQQTIPPSAPIPVLSAPPATPPGPPTAGKVYPAYPSYHPVAEPPCTDALGSAYIPMDSWVYPAMMRL